MRETFIFDRDWRYKVVGDLKDINSHEFHYKMAKAGGSIGPAAKTYDDSDWKKVDIPHDYLVETEFSEDAALSHGYKKRDDFWYRKTFKIDKKYEGKHFLLCFEGISVYSEIYLNGSLLKRSFSAYCEIPLDITDRINFGNKPNILAVHIDANAQEGWWYEGAGIYRHVTLYAKEPLHIEHNGIWINPKIVENTENDWVVNCEVTAENSAYESKDFEVKVTILDFDGSEVTSAAETASIGRNEKKAIDISANVLSPKRWDIDEPNLYRAKVQIFENGELTDEAEENFGFRTFSIDADKGFFLNGKNIKIMGTCNHQDHAGVGIGIPDSVNYYRIQRLKEMGTNAYRCSHNMPTKAVLDACDKIGLIVMDENRRFETSSDVMNQIKTLVKRDRNHPSVMFYSLFNEEVYVQNNAEGKRIFKRMKDEVEKLDDTRLILGGINGVNSPEEGTALVMDVTGYNYDLGSIPAFHKAAPNQPIIGSENNSAVTTRGCYKTDMEKHELSAYDENPVPWGHTVQETWKFVRDNDYMSGIFIWTGFDYRGEPTPFQYPSISSQFGIMDTCGFAKDSFYYNKACFTKEPMMHVMPHWNHKDGEIVRVQTVTNCEEAEVILNGKSLGKKKSDVCEQCFWEVEFEKGELIAIGYNRGVEVARDSVCTTGAAKKICLMTPMESIKDDGMDAYIVNVCAVDESGLTVPTASDLIEFEVIGDADIIGVGNGNPNSHESDVLPKRKLYNGYCQVIIKSRLGAEKIKLIAKSEKLESAETEVKIEKVKTPNFILNTEGRVISDWWMSTETYTEKPDINMFIADNDMNTFEGIGLEFGFQEYTSGYKMFRSKFELAASEGERYKLIFPAVSGSEIEVAINGKVICDIKNPEYEKPVETEFIADGNKDNEIRVVVKAIDGKKSGLKFDVELTV